MRMAYNKKEGPFMPTTVDLDRLLQEVQTLSIEDRLRLVRRVLDSVLTPSNRQKAHRPLKYGEFSGPKMSSEEDFKIAE